MINSSWLVTTGWSLFKNFLHADTRDKVVFLGSDYASTLIRDFGPENVPIEYGGTCNCRLKGTDMCIPRVPSPEEIAAMEEEDLLNLSRASVGSLERNDGIIPATFLHSKSGESDAESANGGRLSVSHLLGRMIRGRWSRGSNSDGQPPINYETLASHWLFG